MISLKASCIRRVAQLLRVGKPQIDCAKITDRGPITFQVDNKINRARLGVVNYWLTKLIKAMFKSTTLV